MSVFPSATRATFGRAFRIATRKPTRTPVLRFNETVGARYFSSKNPDDNNDNDSDDKPFEQWIPPNRPLSGDKGSSHLFIRSGNDDAEVVEGLDEDDELRQLELDLQQEEERAKLVESQQKVSSAEETVDWLQTRRAKQLQGIDMMTPEKGAARKFQDSDVEVIQHTLLTMEEINMCLTAMGGKDITYLPNTPERRMGATRGMILVTGSTPAQIFLLAETLVRQLKRRDLADVGVVGAMYGVEGSDDKMDTWRVVDGYNYIVHIFDADTRRHLNLEALWSGRDPVLRVDFNDDDAVDDYVAAHPVPKGYGPRSDDWSRSILQMERNRWIAPHQPVAKRPRIKKKNKKRGHR